MMATKDLYGPPDPAAQATETIKVSSKQSDGDKVLQDILDSSSRGHDNKGKW